MSRDAAFEWLADMHLCLYDLAEITRGELRLAAMPPRERELTPVGKIVLSAAAVTSGDIYWDLAGRAGDLELAFLRGALGAVTADRRVEPWPGRFCLEVSDPAGALAGVIDCLREAATEMAGEESGAEFPELKVLQLYAAWGVDIYPSTCGRSAKGRLARRCRRQAA